MARSFPSIFALPSFRRFQYHRCNFFKSIGAKRVKSTQGIIKILIKLDFSSGLTHFHAIIGGGGVSPTLGGLVQDWGAQALPKRQKLGTSLFSTYIRDTAFSISLSDYLRHAPCIKKMTMEPSKCGTYYSNMAHAVTDGADSKEEICW